ncbi:primosome assembly protein PriA [cyanobacterium endosymbiont of Rhopalodia gibberula]|uniref:primosomal protein N' n=1 Tax=cyanobacterium endosymbiont of Rhopalodia gibberula TaxID=1763363 RepID=UPI000DC727EF|nr:primosomal protein N' [cyanobacterium endosymbiont of Rhopalodia gibberula]BBA78826.1 primosome assembly protein PriA [cyanobacterium endosymbiont of Rhopalodia gibberula]
MADNTRTFIAAESRSPYEVRHYSKKWIEVLVDCPGVQGLYTYHIPPELSLKPGDILNVPFGSQMVGGIAIRWVTSLPRDLDLQRVRNVEDVITAGFFPSGYWELLNRVAQYYCTDLIKVIRGALPPGLLERSQRRIRLKSGIIPPKAETFCSSVAGQILNLLRSQKNGDYSSQYLHREVREAGRGIRELIKQGWIESYLEPPKTNQPKRQKAVTLMVDRFPTNLTKQQLEVLQVLHQQGGECWLTELVKLCNRSSQVVKKLEEKGCVVIQYQEKLRLLEQPQVNSDHPKPLTTFQTKALDVIKSLESYAEILLHGVTGSGKTEVYLQAIAPLLKQGKSALVLVPEIGLTPQLTDRFRSRFGNKICVYHSNLSKGERYDTWRQMLTGEPQVVIGTRSAIFSPLPNLGLIILDEEHDSSFKQTQIPPTYHARNVALWRGEIDNCPIVLGSATPSLETWIKIANTDQDISVSSSPNSYYLSLPERIESRPLPPVEIIDMRQELKLGNRSIFSFSLQNALAELESSKKQGILFINRRGHSTFVSCRSCGYVLECPHCDVSLSYHYAHEGATKLLRCHYCNYSQSQPSQCPQCSSPYLKFFGSGTQKVTQELTKLFPSLRPLRFDSDTTRTKGSHRSLLTKFSQGKADLLVGTQMLTKGLDLAQITLVGVVTADELLHLSDYRAAERTFQTLTQVAGRAGRGNDPGRVIIQTYSPEHPIIQSVSSHNYQDFIKTELPQREALSYPPYGRLILIRLSGTNKIEVQQTSQVLGDICRDKVREDCEILGPTPASIMRIAKRYRWHILLKFSPNAQVIIPDINDLKKVCPKSVNLTFDIDPLRID